MPLHLIESGVCDRQFERAGGCGDERIGIDAAARKFAAWLKENANPSTAYNYRLSVELFAQFAREKKLLIPDLVEPRDIEKFIDWHRARESAFSTINLRLSALSVFWRFMRRDGIAQNDPVRDVRRLREPDRLPVYLPIRDQRATLRWAAKVAGDGGRRDEAIIATALLAGPRRFELANLKLEHVDVESGTLRVFEGKGKRDRELPMVPRLAAALRRYLPARERLLEGVESPWLFVHKTRCRYVGRRLSNPAIYKIITQCSKKAIGKAVSPHKLRHSFAVRMRVNGAEIQDISEALGHREIATTRIYTKMKTRDRRTVLQRLMA